jgi:anti-sigma factor RsiW
MKLELQQLNAFVDGELDVLAQREIEERLQHDDALRDEVQALRQLRQNVRAHADYHVASDAFRQRIQALAPVAAAMPSRLSLSSGSLQHWFDWRPMMVAFAAMALLVVTLNQTGWRPGDGARLGQEVIASHVRSTLGQHLVDVASSDHHTVKPWLSSKLDFSPPVQETLLPGSVFLGGRVDYLDGRPVAALVYRHGEHIVNSFVWPGQAADSAAAFSAERGFQLAHWSRGGMNHWVISDLNREEFGVMVRAFEAARNEP